MTLWSAYMKDLEIELDKVPVTQFVINEVS
jgi:hypothetical protein